MSQNTVEISNKGINCLLEKMDVVEAGQFISISISNSTSSNIRSLLKDSISCLYSSARFTILQMPVTHSEQRHL